MLPTLTIDIQSILLKAFDTNCLVERPTHDELFDPLGVCHAIDFHSLVEAAQQANNNLDSYLTARIAGWFRRSRPRRPVLIYQFNTIRFDREMAFIVTCSERETYLTSLYSIPGYIENGSELFPAGMAPFMYWDGSRVYRTYAIGPRFLRKQNLTMDIGIMPSSGPLIGPAQKYQIQNFLNAPAENWDYSVVPRQSRQLMPFEGRNVLVYHARIDLDHSIVGQWMPVLWGL